MKRDYYETVETFKIDKRTKEKASMRHYLQIHEGQIKVFVEDGQINIQFWRRKK